MLISNLRSVAEYMHVHRFVPGVAIPHLLGNPALPPEEERLLRLELVAQALELLETPVGSRQEAVGRRQSAVGRMQKAEGSELHASR